MEKKWNNRKVILSLAVSLDGFIEGPNGEIDWLTFSEETGQVLHRFLEEIDTILYGRVSYEKWGAYNPPEDSPDFEKTFYDKTGDMSKYVFSTTRKAFEGRPIVVNSEIEQVVCDLKQQQGKHIWLYGGARLISAFFNFNLIDEIRLAIAPVILGEGKPLFNEIRERKKLNLVKVEGHPSGMVALTYRTGN
jgi:dihydrofolate reductase